MVTLADLDELRDTVARARVVAPVGGRTHWEVGGPPPAGDDVVFVTPPSGVVTYDPADLTVTVGAGMRGGELAAVLRAAGQECALDAGDADSTVGGLLATGLSGHRRLRHGPLRDRVLEVRFVTADGRLVKAGGPTVKNVTGFDLPRLLVGSLGTIGLIVQVTLRAQPLPSTAEWFVTEADPFALRAALYRPSCVAWDGTRTRVLLEGVAADVEAERAAMPEAGAPATAPAWPSGAHRGRISVRPSVLPTLARALDGTGASWLAEIGVGTVHVATDDDAVLARARVAAADHGGWLLREAGAPGLDGFGGALPNARLSDRVRAAFDPDGKFSPGRLPTGPVDG